MPVQVNNKQLNALLIRTNTSTNKAAELLGVKRSYIASLRGVVSLGQPKRDIKAFTVPFSVWFTLKQLLGDNSKCPACREIERLKGVCGVSGAELLSHLKPALQCLEDFYQYKADNNKILQGISPHGPIDPVTVGGNGLHGL